MKVYNKKGLAWGIFWTVLGLFSLYRDFVDPDSFWLQRGKRRGDLRGDGAHRSHRLCQGLFQSGHPGGQD